jgi:hypothetical protein
VLQCHPASTVGPFHINQQDLCTSRKNNLLLIVCIPFHCSNFMCHVCTPLCFVSLLQDMLGGLLDSCLSTCSSISGSIISRAADMLQSIAPEGAPRNKVRRPAAGAAVLSCQALTCHHSLVLQQGHNPQQCKHSICAILQSLMWHASIGVRHFRICINRITPCFWCCRLRCV